MNTSGDGKMAVIDNQIKCRFLLADVWYSSNDNMEYIKFDLKKTLSYPLKRTGW